MMRALRIQLRVIGALMMRELHTRYGRDNLGFLWIVGEPLLFAMGVQGLWNLLNRHEHDLPLVPFLLTGYLPLVLWRHINNRALACIASNKGLLFHRQIRLLDLFIARFALEIGGVLLAFFLAYALFCAVGLMDLPKYLWSLYGGWFLMIWFSVGFGLILGSLGELSEVVEKIYHPLSYLMVPICGCFYMVEWIPDHYRPLAMCVPMVDAIELIRGGYFGERVHTYANIPYVVCFCTAELFVGLMLVRYIKRKISFE